ncbi:MAG TPA: AAA family ATPase [Pseudonocardiaceae bacterium]|nr:AAA family ATPase [Pseudonocardiaceae bacterium]
MTGEPAPSADKRQDGSPQHMDVHVSGGGDAYAAGRDQHFHYESGVRRTKSGDGAGAKCPYPGLAPFSTQFSDWFYGRDEVVATVCQRLDTRLQDGGPLVVIGPSGVGKSSLLAAGVLPAIAAGSLPAAGSKDWPQLTMTPTAAPAAALARTLGLGGDENLLRLWRSQPERCVDDVRRLADGNNGTSADSGPAGLVMIVDQFEELFTLCENEIERQWFVDVLDRLARPPEHNAAVVLGLRADYYAPCMAHDQLRAALRTDPVLLEPMTEDEIKQVIRFPARDVGLEVETGLVDVLLADLGGPGGGLGAGHRAAGLPLLAHALRATWQQRDGHLLTIDAYHLTGRIQGAIARTAERLFESLTPDGRDLARTVFLRLVVVGLDADDVRRHVRHHDLVHDLPDPTLAANVVDAFTQGRLLTKERDTVTIAHEAMITAWPRLHDWIGHDRSGNLIHQDIEDAAALWDRSERDTTLLYSESRLADADTWAAEHARELSGTAKAYLSTARHHERHSKRLRRATIAGVLALALVASSAAVFAFRQNALLRAAAATTLDDQVASEATQLASTDPSLAAQFALVAYRLAPNQDNTSTLVNLENTPLGSGLAVSGRTVSSTAFSPNDRVLATGDSDGAVRLWDMADPTHPNALGQPLTGRVTSIAAVAFSPKGNMLAAGGANGTVYLWSVADPTHPTAVRPQLTLRENVVNTVAFSPDGQTLAAGGTGNDNASGTVGLWHLDGRDHVTSLGQFVVRHSPVDSVAFSPDGQILADGTDDDTVQLWRLDRNSPPITSVSTLRTPATTIAFSPGGPVLATGGTGGAVRLWNMTNPIHPTDWGQPLADQPADATAFSPDGNVLAVSHEDGSITCWNVAQPSVPSLLQSLTGPSIGSIEALAFRPDGHTLAGASNSGVLVLWSLPPSVLVGNPGPVAVNPVRHLLATTDGGSTVQLWNVADPAVPIPLAHIDLGVADPSESLAFDHDGRMLAIGGGTVSTGTVWLMNVTDPRHPAQRGRLTGFSGSVGSLAFGPEAHTLAATDEDGDVSLWNVVDPRNPSPLGHPLAEAVDSTGSVTFSPDGHTLLTGGGLGAVWSWNVPTGRSSNESGQPLIGEDAVTTSMAFSPDGHTLAVGNNDNTIGLWDVTGQGAPARPGPALSGMSGGAEAMAFSPDGHTLAVGGEDGTVWLWQVTGQAAPTFLGHLPAGSTTETGVQLVAFIGEHSFVSVDEDGVIRLWDLHVDHAVQRVCAISADALTRQQWSRYLPPQLAYRPPCAT